MVGEFGQAETRQSRRGLRRFLPEPSQARADPAGSRPELGRDPCPSGITLKTAGDWPEVREGAKWLQQEIHRPRLRFDGLASILIQAARSHPLLPTIFGDHRSTNRDSVGIHDINHRSNKRLPKVNRAMSERHRSPIRCPISTHLLSDSYLVSFGQLTSDARLTSQLSAR